jgi:hypothetical protein
MDFSSADSEWQQAQYYDVIGLTKFADIDVGDVCIEGPDRLLHSQFNVLDNDEVPPPTQQRH